MSLHWNPRYDLTHDDLRRYIERRQRWHRRMLRVDRYWPWLVMLACVVALILLLTSCKQKMVQVPVEEAPANTIAHSDATGTMTVTVPEDKLTDAQKIALLRAEAHKRHLRWRVWCADLGPDWMFQGWAVQPGDDFEIYVEEGAKPNWNSHSATQADAAYKLYAEIQQAPNDPPHKSKGHEHEHKQCPPELRGE